MKVYTVPEVAEMLKVSQQTIWRWLNSGLIPHRKIGIGRGSVRFLDSDVKAFLKKSKINPITPLRS